MGGGWSGLGGGWQGGGWQGGGWQGGGWQGGGWQTGGGGLGGLYAMRSDRPLVAEDVSKPPPADGNQNPAFPVAAWDSDLFSLTSPLQSRGKPGRTGSRISSLRWVRHPVLLCRVMRVLETRSMTFGFWP